MIYFAGQHIVIIVSKDFIMPEFLLDFKTIISILTLSNLYAQNMLPKIFTICKKLS